MHKTSLLKIRKLVKIRKELMENAKREMKVEINV